MADPERRRAPAEHPSHDDHDLLLVAAVAAGDAEAGDAEAGDAEAGDRGPADDLLAACPACAVVAKDLRAIQAATAAVPAPARGRDFRLTLADAERLRPRGWRGLLSGLARPRPERAYPVAAG
ncbi:MAG TPA: hypothetical protein VM344_08795, partial [Vitreimonas sp.]|nr:hypothetical protein [Vitreimonas sp.]